MASRDFRRQLTGYGLTTAQILYRRPDHPWLLQTYVWQNYDLFPKFPELQRFLAFWMAKLEGPLHSVRSRTPADQAGRAEGDQRRVSAALSGLPPSVVEQPVQPTLRRPSF